MKNSDMPAMPCSVSDPEARQKLISIRKDAGGFSAQEIKSMAHAMSHHGGLTKREHFAAMAMQGYCSVGEGWDQPAGEVARCAVAMADALLAELERTQ